MSPSKPTATEWNKYFRMTKKVSLARRQELEPYIFVLNITGIRQGQWKEFLDLFFSLSEFAGTRPLYEEAVSLPRPSAAAIEARQMVHAYISDVLLNVNKAKARIALTKTSAGPPLKRPRIEMPGKATGTVEEVNFAGEEPSDEPGTVTIQLVFVAPAAHDAKDDDKGKRLERDCRPDDRGHYLEQGMTDGYDWNHHSNHCTTVTLDRPVHFQGLYLRADASRALNSGEIRCFYGATREPPTDQNPHFRTVMPVTDSDSLSTLLRAADYEPVAIMAILYRQSPDKRDNSPTRSGADHLRRADYVLEADDTMSVYEEEPEMLFAEQFRRGKKRFRAPATLKSLAKWTEIMAERLEDDLRAARVCRTQAQKHGMTNMLCLAGESCWQAGMPLSTQLREKRLWVELGRKNGDYLRYRRDHPISEEERQSDLPFVLDVTADNLFRRMRTPDTST